MSRSEKPAEFFVDRSLGKSIVAGLRDVGLTVHSMADIYGEKRAQGNWPTISFGGIAEKTVSSTRFTASS